MRRIGVGIVRVGRISDLQVIEGRREYARVAILLPRHLHAPATLASGVLATQPNTARSFGPISLRPT